MVYSEVEIKRYGFETKRPDEEFCEELQTWYFLESLCCTRIVRVSCVSSKTAWVEGGDDGYIKFATTSLRSRSTNGKVQYSHEQRKTYLIPANQAIGNTMRLRLAPAKNNQEKGVKWAKDYEL